MAAAGVLPLPGGEERGEARQPLLPAAREIPRGEGVGEVLEPVRVPAFQEGIGARLEFDVSRPQLSGQPVVLVEADTSGKGKVWAEAHEHPAPGPIIHVEVVLDDPALGQLQVPAVVLRVADGDQDARWFAGPEDDDHLVGLGALKVGRDKLVAPTGRRVDDGSAPRQRAVLYPVLELVGDVAEHVAAHGVLIPVGVEEPDHTFGLLEGLDKAVEQDPVEAPIPKANAILMVLVERVHGHLLRGEIPGAYAMNGSTGVLTSDISGISRAQPLAS
jgi:hypothetical protein